MFQPTFRRQSGAYKWIFPLSYPVATSLNLSNRQIQITDRYNNRGGVNINNIVFCSPKVADFQSIYLWGRWSS